MFVLAFVLNEMSSFPIFQDMEKFDGANFSPRCALCFPSMGFEILLMGVQQILMMKMKLWITTKRQPKHLHYIVNISHLHNVHTFNIVRISRMLGKHFVVCTKFKPSETSCFFEGSCFIIKMQEGEDLLAHINMVKALVDQLRSIEVKIENESIYHEPSHIL